MSTVPIVSIITPAFNAAAHIGDTARSVLAQTFERWEWIITDDGSTDETADIVASMSDPRVTLIRAQHAGLPAVVRNVALSRARARVIALLDADDVWRPEKLATQLAYLDAHEEVGLVFSRFHFYFEDLGHRSRRAFPSLRGVPNPGILFEQTCHRNLICTSSVIVRRELLDRYGGFDEDPEQRGTEDVELWLRLAPHVKFGCIDEPLVTYRFYSRSVSANSVAIARGRILAIEKAIARNPGVSLPPALSGRRMKARQLAWLGYAQLRDGVGDRGTKSLRDSVRLDPTNTAAWLFLVLSCFPRALTQWLRSVGYRLF